MKDKDYIEGLLNKNSKTIELIYQTFASKIQRYVIGKGGSIEDAKDVFQDALMLIYKKSQSPDFKLTSQFYTYLFGICRHLYDRKRKKKSNNNVTIIDDNRFIDEYDIENAILKQEKHTLYELNFQKLGIFCQQLLSLFYAKTSMQEIATQLNLKNEHTARTRKYRCQKKLEEFIKSDTRFEELL